MVAEMVCVLEVKAAGAARSRTCVLLQSNPTPNQDRDAGFTYAAETEMD